MPPALPAIPIQIADLARLVSKDIQAGQPRLIGLTGSVASGKSTLAAALSAALSDDFRVETVSTDGFLFPNSCLSARNLLMRKGFPETYDQQNLHNLLRGVRSGPVAVPVYSHSLYDIDQSLTRHILQPDILLIEGLGLQDAETRDLLDHLIYLDADPADIESWFLDRFMAFWRDAEHDPSSFYRQFRNMTPEQTIRFAKGNVWEAINLPNLIEHIQTARDLADILLWKSADHNLHLMKPALF